MGRNNSTAFFVHRQYNRKIYSQLNIQYITNNRYIKFESDIDLIYIALLFYKIQLILTNPSSIIINERPALWLYKFPVYLLKSIGRDSYPLSSKT